MPHFTTFGKNYKRRFEGSGLFEEIFARILEKCYARGFVNDGIVFVDATHIKASPAPRSEASMGNWLKSPLMCMMSVGVSPQT